ncbi:hypothetical protein EIP91_005876 [Steccherinum ochraceum]|uniref:EthD domain-containing protein n=1 Tax=Steccherinum ochraceum TaxID=92696 RepID=A0A4R0REY7_9APHY|nr:hypothetical protein EIP91_005876 [Steccherinum ochraceum]
MPELSKDRVRLVAFLHPKPDASFDEFSSYWVTTHGPLFMSLAIVKQNLLRYEQFHFTPAANAQNPRHTLPYWGCAIFEAASFELIHAVFADPEYARVVRPDEEKFFDVELTEVTAGHVAVFLDKDK